MRPWAALCIARCAAAPWPGMVLEVDLNGAGKAARLAWDATSEAEITKAAKGFIAEHSFEAGGSCAANITGCVIDGMRAAARPRCALALVLAGSLRAFAGDPALRRAARRRRCE